MKLTSKQHDDLGLSLYKSLKAQTTIAPLTNTFDDIDIEDGYLISKVMLTHRLTNDGVSVIGKKIGVTSAPVQKMLGVFQPDFGFLTSDMIYKNGATISISNTMIQPKAEAEIAFRLNKDLLGPNVTEQDVLDATECIMPCFEIVDSRIDDWKIKIEDTVADNASCGVFVLGDVELDPREHDLPNLSVKVFKNDQPLSEGLGSAVQGNPLTAVAWLANTLGEFGIELKAGEVILSGSVVPLEPVVAGDKMHMELEGLGSTTLFFS